MRAAILFLALGLTQGAAHAADEAGREAARATVARQIEAFRTDDAATAYAQAAPAIQGMFPSPDTFLAMVRKGYAAVYRARTFRVDRVEDVGTDGVALGATVQDEAGADWLGPLHPREAARWCLAHHRLPADEGAGHEHLIGAVARRTTSRRSSRSHPGSAIGFDRPDGLV